MLHPIVNTKVAYKACQIQIICGFVPSIFYLYPQKQTVMTMYALDIPTAYYREIYPTLQECIGLKSELLVDSMNMLLNIYSSQSDDTETGELYGRYIDIPPLSEERIPMDVRFDTDRSLEFVLKISKRMPVLLDKEYVERFKQFMEYYVRENKEYWKSDNGTMLHVGLLCLLSLYGKYKESPDFGWNDFYNEYGNMDYAFSIRPDLLKLYRHLHEENTSQEAVLQFGNGKKLKLSNAGNWIKGMALQYLNARLGLCDMESVLEELEDDYPEKKKAGRRQENPLFDTVLIGAYNLLKRAGFIPSNKLLPDTAAKFLRRFLKNLGLIQDDDGTKDDNMYIRSKISFLREAKFKPVWYNSPNMKADPVEMEWLDKLEDEGKLIPNDGFVLHPILVQRMFQGMKFGNPKD